MATDTRQNAGTERVAASEVRVDLREALSEPDAGPPAPTTAQAEDDPIEQLISQLQSTALGIQSEWRGVANSSFESAMGEWQQAARNIQLAATQIGQATSTAGGNYQDTETANASMFR